MTKFFFLFYLFLGSVFMKAQTHFQRRDTLDVNQLEKRISQLVAGPPRDSTRLGTLGPDYVFIVPLSTIETEKKEKAKYPYADYVYPLLIVNDVIIRDPAQVECFRRKYLHLKRKSKYLTQNKALKRNIHNVPRDGVVFVTISKKYVIDLSCPPFVE